MTKQKNIKESLFIGAIFNFDNDLFHSLLKDKDVDVSCYDNRPLRDAAEYGNAHCVKELLKDKRVDPSARSNYATYFASTHGHIEVLKLLLKDKRVDPSCSGNKAIVIAFYNKQNKVIELLWNDKRVKNTLQNDYEKIYNDLIKKDIKNKVSDF